MLLILAGISIQTLFGENGIFKTANDAVTEYEKQEVVDKFNIHIISWQTDKVLGKSNSITDLWQKLQDGGIIKNKTTDVSSPISTDKGKIYQVSTTDGYIVEVIVDEQEKISIGVIAKAEKFPPRIVGVETTKTTSSIHVEVNVQRLNDDGKITYSYKKQDEAKYTELKTSKELTADFTGLEQNIVYNIQIVANNKNGSSNIETINVLTGSLKSGTVMQEGETIWDKAAHTATIRVKTAESIPQGTTLEYQVNSVTGKWLAYDQITGITNLNHGNIVYVRLYDGRNETIENGISILDGTVPEPATISDLTNTTIPGQTITATVTHTDNQSGINLSSCKWIFDTTSGEIGTTNSAWNTATTFERSNSINITVPNIAGTYYLHVLSVDQAEKKRETTSTAIKVVEVISKETSYEWYYADIEEDGIIDGIIYEDYTAHGEETGNDNLNGLKEYTISTRTYEGQTNPGIYKANEGFGTKQVISPVKGSGEKDRFYIMALEDIKDEEHDNLFCWYDAAADGGGKIDEYDFDRGKANTNYFMNKWDTEAWGKQNDNETYQDLWGAIKEKVAKGWFLPSLSEWGTIGIRLEKKFGETPGNFYQLFGLSYEAYWSSSADGGAGVWVYYPGIPCAIAENSCEFPARVRLCMTF